ncbi:unnamed protein product [Cylindrotheca closterium]|uniref:PS II complex 12 kDa extrinsic protein n=1 Tax=Cylindrotheca closterium TaxID=2856 RepID=A0AAD2FJ34_9STRA|nr:unnamed protein product [Cylindrotheca closterium]
MTFRRLLVTLCCITCQYAYTLQAFEVPISRRAALGSFAAAMTVPNVVMASPETKDEINTADSKATAEKQSAAKKKAEKEARRMAEETKKRLAVGRIGTI